MALGYPSVEACQAAISSREFTEWQAYDRLEPLIPNWRELFGTVVATQLNTLRQKASDKLWIWRDVFPSVDDPPQAPRSQSTEEQIAMVEALNLAFGGSDLRHEKTSSA